MNTESMVDRYESGELSRERDEAATNTANDAVNRPANPRNKEPKNNG